MKKIFSLLLVLAMCMSLFAGCAQGIGDNPTTPTGITPPTEDSDIPGAPFVLTGLFFKTESGLYILMSEERGLIIMQNGASKFEGLNDYSLVNVTTEMIMESYPAQTVIFNISPNIHSGSELTKEEYERYNELYNEAQSLGYTSASPWPYLPNAHTPESPIETTPEVLVSGTVDYNKLGTMVDAINLANDDVSNILFSPMSLNFALGMLANGIDTEAASDIASEFEGYFGMSISDYNDYVIEYMANCTNKDDVKFEIANSVWVKEGYEFTESFKNTVSDIYDAEVESRIFDESFVKEVNQWCADKTHDMIQNILLRVPPDANTVSMLINALYFEATWDEPYEEHQIKEIEFNNFSGSVTTTDAMHGTEKMTYIETADASGFMKNYDDNRYSFVAILPKETEGDFALSDIDLNTFMKEEYWSMEDVYHVLPEFEFDNTHSLLDILDGIGMPVGSFGFGNIVKDDVLFPSNIIQKTAIEVTRSGTKASAVTVVEMQDGAMAPIDKPEPKEVILDRPFAFMIYDTEMETPLFIGKVAEFPMA